MSNEEHEGKDRPEADSANGAESGEGSSAQDERDQRRASDDLAEGLELMLRAARKAVRDIDTKRIEDLGRRARRSLENLNPKKVEEFGRKAAEKLDPRRIEEIANEAGRELINVVERVADRVDRAVASSGVRRKRSAESSDADAAPAADEGTESDDQQPRVRVED